MPTVIGRGDACYLQLTPVLGQNSAVAVRKPLLQSTAFTRREPQVKAGLRVASIWQLVLRPFLGASLQPLPPQPGPAPLTPAALPAAASACILGAASWGA
eukprot:TRINITY_DN789_c0_g1_i3.p1 TRINITY_DN789_c0_g1~~TRINITY_DN789_c0_g1_i3.p1  ORF type:complete len:100 (+),score=1.48 TRINITY_DN789_c0_g1_i3:339-638(+)